MSVSESESEDDDLPITARKKEDRNVNGRKSRSNGDSSGSESSDSDSDSQVPITQMGNNNGNGHRPRTKNASNASFGSKSNGNNDNSSSSGSEESESDSDNDRPVLSGSHGNENDNSNSHSHSNSNSNDNNNDNTNDNNNDNKKSKKHRRKRNFEDSDTEESSDSDDDSSGDAPLVAAATIHSHAPNKPPANKRRRVSKESSNSSSNSPIMRNGGNKSSKASKSSKTNKTSKRRHSSKSGNASGNASVSSSVSGRSRKGKSGAKNNENGNSPRRSSVGSSTSIMSKSAFVTKEVNPASMYQVKTEIVPLETDKNAIKWWDRDIAELLSDTKKWHTLDHNGVVFAPEYEPHGIKMKYDGKKVDLTPDQEEIATMYAVMLETDWIAKKQFQKNFMSEWKKVLNDKKQEKTHPYIKDLSKCDFRDIYDWYQKKREETKELKKDKEYKEKLKEEKEDLDNKYGFALVDGIKEKVGNYKVEPPGLFRGRGEHPKMGLLKKRLQPEDVILNIGTNTKIPACPIKGHQWGGVIHDQSVTYIAKWIENINGQHKFVYLHSSSRFKGESDLKKYEKARKLKSCVERIRKDYASKLASKSLHLRQLATAVWIIDHLSIRVGNEKDTDEEADTVGVCSLRLEHIKFNPMPECEKERATKEFLDSELTLESLDHNLKTGYVIELNFLGKDSMLYHQVLQVPRVIYMNLKIFCDKKKHDQDIFHKIDPTKVNEYLKDQMPGLTAKVFRTHNASVCLQQELSTGYSKQTGKISPKSPLADKIFFYNQCNLQVALLCNHQKSVSKSHSTQMEKMNEQIKDCKKQLKELESELKVAQGKKDRSSLKHDVKKLRSVEQLKASIARKKEVLRKKELAKATKDDNKQAALGTSKINYMDPRITVAWCKKMEVPIEKVFNKSLLDKFPWAMNAKLEFEF